MPEMRRDGYLAVGAGCTPFETEVDLAQAEQLRDVLQLEFFDALPVRTPLLTDEADKSMCARAFHDRSDPELESLPSIFAAGIIHSYYSPESWRMTVMHTKLRRARHNNSQQRVESRLNIEVWDRQVVEAIRKVRIVRGVGELTAEAVERQMMEDAVDGPIVTQRRAYERQITPNDCDAAAELLRRVARRSLVSDRQRYGDL